MTVNRRKQGAFYEEMAAVYLEEQGVRILERNFRCPYGEIDLIGREGNLILFCEVKYRRTCRAGDPTEAVDERKQERIYRTALWYLQMKRDQLGESEFRFDVIGIREEKGKPVFRWIRDAFGGF